MTTIAGQFAIGLAPFEADRLLLAISPQTKAEMKSLLWNGSSRKSVFTLYHLDQLSKVI